MDPLTCTACSALVADLTAHQAWHAATTSCYVCHLCVLTADLDEHVLFTHGPTPAPAA